MTKLAAVLFDLWGTLIVDPDERSRPRQLWRAANVVEALATQGLMLSPETADEALRAASAELTAMHDAGLDVSAEGRVDLFWRHVHGAPALPAAARPALERAICAMHPVHRPVVADGALEVLRQTKALGLATALVSNAGLTSAPNLRLMVDDYGLAPYLDVLIFSDDFELAKPDARLFHAATTRLGVPAAAAAFVGDSPHNDIHGARGAGLLAVQIGHRHAPPVTGYRENDGAVPHARIESLSELLPALRQIAALPSAG